MTQACQIHNSLPTRGHDPPLAPLQWLTGRSPTLSHFRVWGCDCFATIANASDLPTSVTSTRIRCVNLGWDPRRLAHFIYIPELGRITQSIDVDF
eukprot:468986-Prymnesium_polylepis.1